LFKYNKKEIVRIVSFWQNI